jgi:hypothetical protein
LFLGWQVPVEESVRKVEEFRELQRGLLDRYEGIERWLNETEAEHPGLPYWLMTVGYGKHVSRALTAWCDETLAALREMASRAETHKSRSTKDE